MAREKLPQLRGAPSWRFRRRGTGSRPAVPAVVKTHANWSTKVKTRDLNDWLGQMVQRHPPPAVNGKRIKPKYMAQIKARPPTFVLFASRADQMPDSYRRYLIHGIRESFDLPGVPIRITIKRRESYAAGGEQAAPQRLQYSLRAADEEGGAAAQAEGERKARGRKPRRRGAPGRFENGPRRNAGLGVRRATGAVQPVAARRRPRRGGSRSGGNNTSAAISSGGKGRGSRREGLGEMRVAVPPGEQGGADRRVVHLWHRATGVSSADFERIWPQRRGGCARCVRKPQAGPRRQKRVIERKAATAR